MKELTLTALVSFLLLLGEAGAETFYVCDGGDASQPEISNCATAYDPSDFNIIDNWGTEDADDGLIGPGDSVTTMGTIREMLVVQRSGLPTSPITVKGSSGSVIKGSDVLFGWTSGPPIYEAPLATSPANVYFDGSRGVQEEGNCPGDLDTDQEWCHTNGTLYQYSAYDPSIRYTCPGTEVVKRPYGIVAISKDYITLDSLEVRHTGSYAIYDDQGNNWVVKGSNLQGYVDAAIKIRGVEEPVQAVEIYNNTIGVADQAPSFLYGSGYGGIVLYGTNGALVHNNYIATKNQRAILVGQAANGVISTSGEIYDNEITNCQTGIEITMGSANFKVYRNYIHDSKGAGLMSQWGASGTKFHYNIIYNLSISDVQDHYNGIDINTGSVNGEIYNNLVKKVERACMTVEAYSAPADGWEIKNNIFDARENPTPVAPIQIVSGITSITLANNDYVPNANNHVGRLDGTYYDTYGAWEAAVDGAVGGRTLTEDDGITGDPLLWDPANGDFNVSCDSPVRNAGTDVSLTSDYDGKAVPLGAGVDIGALESMCQMIVIGEESQR